MCFTNTGRRWYNPTAVSFFLGHTMLSPSTITLLFLAVMLIVFHDVWIPWTIQKTRQKMFNLRNRLLGNKQLPSKIVGEIIPNNLRYIDKYQGIMVVELPPNKRNIFTHRSNSFLYFPYTYLSIQFRSMRHNGKDVYIFDHLDIGFSDFRLSKTADCVRSLPLSNISGFSVCLGSGSPSLAFNDLKSLSNAVVTSFWGSSFEMCKSELAKWENATRKGKGESFVAGISSRHILPLYSISKRGVINSREKLYNYQPSPSGNGSTGNS